MGGACCVAAGDKTIQNASSGEILHRNFRHSPSWSFRWDNRVGVVGEETSIGWLSDVSSRNYTQDVKSTTNVSPHASDEASSLENYRMGTLHKSLMNHETDKDSSISASGEPTSRDAVLEVSQSTKSPQVSDPAFVKLSPSIDSKGPFSMSPRHQLTQQESDSPGLTSAHSSTASRWVQVSPRLELAQQEPDSHSSRVSYGRSSDGWSAHAFSKLMSLSRRERWSFDNDDKLSRTSCRNSRSVSMDFQTCGICSKTLTQKSPWSTQKIGTQNELSVVAILICGHVYHAECLETMTPENDKYDPACPVCTFGEKKTLKLFGKMLKEEEDLKARRSKKLRNRVVGSNESFDFDYWKSSANEGRSPKLSSSSSLKISGAKPFLRRHFSFGSRANKSATQSPSIRKKGLFWAKSTRD